MSKQSSTVSKREEVAREFKWDLTTIYETDQAWEDDFRLLEDRLAELAEYKGQLSQSATKLYQLLELSTNLERIMGKLYSYAARKSDQDTRVSEYQSLNGRAQSLANRLNSAQSFIVPELIDLSESKLAEFMTKEPKLKEYHHYLDDILRRQEHFLSASEEKLIALSGDLAQGPQNVFAMINNADIKFPTITDEEGQEIEVSHGRYIDLLKNGSKEVRKKAFKAYHKLYQSQKNALAANLNTNVKKNIFYRKARNYDSALEASLDKNNISTKVYDNLVTAINEQTGLMHQYMELKKEVLGYDKLAIYDIYKPLVNDVDFKIDYKEAQTIILEALAPLGSDYQAKLSEALDNNWIDVYENQGKRSGAYSASCYDAHPYILLNYEPGIDSLFTLAHELGHAMHSYYSAQSQPYQYSGYSIFLAEIASTVNETLLMDYLLKSISNKEKKLYLLDHYLEKFRGTVYRQTLFAEFEREIHKQVEAGEVLTAELLAKLYLDLNRKYYGEQVEFCDELAVEWARIPHFYYNFYVYQYATGFSVAVDLASKIKTEPGMVNKYLSFLKGGSACYPLDLLLKTGVDMTSVTPIENGLQKFASLLKEVKAL